eukprot:2415852-Pleurochrysis_carterae.AAC.1
MSSTGTTLRSNAPLSDTKLTTLTKLTKQNPSYTPRQISMDTWLNGQLYRVKFDPPGSPIRQITSTLDECNKSDDYVSDPSELDIRISPPDANHRLYPGKIYPGNTCTRFLGYGTYCTR